MGPSTATGVAVLSPKHDLAPGALRVAGKGCRVSALAHQQAFGVDSAVLWLGAGAVPHGIAASLSARGVRLAESGPHPVPPGRLCVLDERGLRPKKDAKRDLRGRRIVVLHSDPEHANLLSWALSARGALTRTFDPGALDATAAFDADVVLVDETEAFAACWEHLCAIWRHARLRWSPCVLLSWSQLERGSEAELDAVCLTVQRLCSEYDSHAALASKDEPLQLAFDQLGPARSLRAVLEQGSSRELRFATARVTIDVHVSDHMILGARGRFRDGSSIELRGARALACLIAEESGTMQVSPQLEDPLSNVMASFDEALVRGPDGAWLSESVVATLPTFADVGDPCGFEDETLFARRGPSASGVCAKTQPMLRAVEDALEASAPEPEDDEESRVPTRKLIVATLVEGLDSEDPEDITEESESTAPREPAARLREVPVLAPARAPSKLALRGVELTDERPSGIRLVSRPRKAGLVARVLALGLLLAGVLSVESDHARAESLFVQGLLTVDAWVPVTLRLDSRPSRVTVAVPTARSRAAQQ